MAARKTNRKRQVARSRGGEARGAKRVRRQTAARTARAEGPHSAEVRQRINEAIQQGQRLRREIESRIEAGLKEAGRTRKARGTRAKRR